MAEAVFFPPVSINLDVSRAEIPEALAIIGKFPCSLVGVNLPTWFNGDTTLLERVKAETACGDRERFVGINCRLDDYPDKILKGVESLLDGPVTPNSLTIHPNDQSLRNGFGEVIDLCRAQGVLTVGYADTHRNAAPHDGSLMTDDECLRATGAADAGYNGFLVSAESLATVSEYIKSHRPGSDIKLVAQKFDKSLTDRELMNGIRQVFGLGCAGIYLAGSFYNRKNPERFMRRVLKFLPPELLVEQEVPRSELVDAGSVSL